MGNVIAMCRPGGDRAAGGGGAPPPPSAVDALVISAIAEELRRAERDGCTTRRVREIGETLGAAIEQAFGASALAHSYALVMAEAIRLRVSR